jgi:hypothetical protein
MRELVVREELLESVEIEAVLDVLDINFAKEVMVFQIAEPGDPSAL